MTATTARSSRARLARALAHHAELGAAAAEHRSELPWGSALHSPTTPRAREVNVVRVERPAPGLTAAALATIADRLQEGLPNRRLEISDEGTADRLVPELEAAGWVPDLILLMAHTGATPDAAAEVAAATPGELVALREQWLRDEIGDRERDVPELIEQILAAEARLRAAVAWRAFCVREAGSPVGMAWLLGTGGDAAMIENVYVAPSHRGRGLGAALVRTAAAAAHAAGASLTYLPTDADGLARLFYRRLGFTELGVIARALRRR